MVGPAVNVTSRIEDQTLPGEILVAKSTLNACSLACKLGREIELRPKGVSEIIDVSAVESIDTTSSGQSSQFDSAGEN